MNRLPVRMPLIATTNCSLTLDVATSVVAFFSDQPTPPVGITISPASASLQIEGTQQFTAQVTNAQDATIDWSVMEGAAGGTVTAAGLYQAPVADRTFHVVRTNSPHVPGSAARVKGSLEELNNLGNDGGESLATAQRRMRRGRARGASAPPPPRSGRRAAWT